MDFFHYSAERYSVLKTLEYQKKNAGEKNSIGLDYEKHISFFFEKPPLEKMGVIFDGKNSFWVAGAEVWEHTVTLAAFGSFRYRIVESPEKTELYYDDKISVAEYHERLDALLKEKGYEGSDGKALTTALEPLKGTTRKCFLLLPTRRDFEEIAKKYAATVPHVMVYPDSGQIRVSSSRKVKIGGNAKRSVIAEWVKLNKKD